MTVSETRPEKGDGRSAREDAEGSTNDRGDRPRRRATRSSRTTNGPARTSATVEHAQDGANGGEPRRETEPRHSPEPEALPTFEVHSHDAAATGGKRGGRRGRGEPREDAENEDVARTPPARRQFSGPNQPRRYPSPIDVAKIDADVLRVVTRLVRAGYEAYLVGGCVRDLLLLHRPKDFDVATSARPEEVRRLFRNSRVIGRRFRLVHVLFGGNKVIEVATFRRNPRDEVAALSHKGADGGDRDEQDDRELLIRTDNSFGEAHEDAERRDFTINALLYDTESNEILDFVGGMADIDRRVVNTIGDPEVRFLEDPVRILRALKFAGKLGLGIHPAVYDAIVRCRESLTSAARPRVSEEVLRLLRGGAARRTIFLAWETGVLDVLLPELSSLLADALSSDDEDGSAGARAFRLLRFVDDEIAANGPMDDAILWTMLLLEPLKEACDGARDRATAVADFLEPLVERLGIPRRFADTMRRVLGVLPRLESGKAGRFARTELFELALVVARGDLTAQRASLAPLKAFSGPGVPVPPPRGGRPPSRDEKPIGGGRSGAALQDGGRRTPRR